MAISTIFSFVYLFFAIFQCGYPKSGWVFMANKLTGRCASKPTILGMGYTHAVIMSATDWMFAILPISLLRNSTIPRREKITVWFILTIGAV